MQDVYTKEELVETFEEMKKQEMAFADEYMKDGRYAGVDWHMGQVALLKELIALVKAGAL